MVPCHVIRMFSNWVWFIFHMFFKHRMHIFLFTHSNSMSILSQVCYCLPCISYFILETNVLILSSLGLIVSLCGDKPMLSLDLNNGLLTTAPQVINHFVGQQLLNIWKRHVTAILPKSCCLESNNSYVPSSFM